MLVYQRVAFRKGASRFTKIGGRPFEGYENLRLNDLFQPAMLVYHAGYIFRNKLSSSGIRPLK